MTTSTPTRCYLFIDIQNFLFSFPPDTSAQLPAPDIYLPRWEKLLADARAAPDVLVAHVQHTEGPGEPGERDTEPWKLRFPPHDGEPVYEKRVVSVWESNPNLADDLRARGINELIVAGSQSEMCVEAACRGALEAGFAKVVVLAGAHATLGATHEKAESIQRKVEEELKKISVDVVAWDEYQW